jgi:hypothetical protein
MAPRTAALEQERPTLRMVSEETDRALAVPMEERLGLAFALAIGKTDLEDSLATVRERRRHCKGRVGARERVSEEQRPRLLALLDQAR